MQNDNLLIIKKVLKKGCKLAYSFISEVGKFGEELPVPGLSRRYEADIPHNDWHKKSGI